MSVTDIRAMKKLADEHGLLLIADNTFLSPYFQNPLDLGADLVIHSGTKFLNGHNDVLAGFVCTAREDLARIDCRGLSLSVEALEEMIVYKAGLWLDSGAIFGVDGEGFERINVACPRGTLKEALERLEKAVRELPAYFVSSLACPYTSTESHFPANT